MKKYKYILILFLLVFFVTGCDKSEQAITEITEYHAILILSNEKSFSNQEKFNEFLDKIITYSSDENNKVDLIYFSGIDASKMMEYFQNNIDFEEFPKNITILSLPNELSVAEQIVEYNSDLHKNNYEIYKHSIYGDRYSEEEALLSANALYNEYANQEDLNQIQNYLENNKNKNFEEQKTAIHDLKKKDFAINFFSESQTLSFREFNMLISEEEKTEVINSIFQNCIDFINNF
ncbi:MAG: hypothetical protein ABID45_02105 [Patescibacteria group bacterium]